MPRKLSAAVTAAAASAVMLLAVGGPASADAPRAAAASPGTCSGTIVIDGLAFDPATVAPGGTSAATLTATNCTGLSQAVTETWTGRFSSLGSTGIPAGCPAIDPLPRSATFAPHAQVSTTTTYLVFAGCTADRLTVTVTISQNGVQLTRQSADLVIAATP